MVGDGCKCSIMLVESVVDVFCYLGWLYDGCLLEFDNDFMDYYGYGIYVVGIIVGCSKWYVSD